MHPDLIFYIFVAIFIGLAAAAPAQCFAHRNLQHDCFRFSVSLKSKNQNKIESIIINNK
jgi:hypothetical protein